MSSMKFVVLEIPQDEALLYKSESRVEVSSEVPQNILFCSHLQQEQNLWPQHTLVSLKTREVAHSVPGYFFIYSERDFWCDRPSVILYLSALKTADSEKCITGKQQFWNEQISMLIDWKALKRRKALCLFSPSKDKRRNRTTMGWAFVPVLCEDSVQCPRMLSLLLPEFVFRISI